jgi:hypothetical protein
MAKIPYNDSNNPSSDYLRGQQSSYKRNFFNELFSSDLVTIHGNKANFRKSFDKTQTAIINKLGSLKVEISYTNGTTQLVDVGDYIVRSTRQSSKDNSITLQLEDLAKPLIDEPAVTVNNGYQWHRNVPLKFLVEELIKKKYFDPRSGEVPREYIIDGIRLRSIDDEFVISSLGKPPSFSRLSSENNGTGVCRVILVKGTKIYLGINQFLWEYDDRTLIYNLLGKLSSASGLIFNIKKLWLAGDDTTIYGMGWPEEELVNIDSENEDTKFSCPVGNEFIIFKYSISGLEILFDSTDSEDFAILNHKLFSGEFHIVPPYFLGKHTTSEDYEDACGIPYPSSPVIGFPLTPNIDGWSDNPENDGKIYQILTGQGAFTTSDSSWNNKLPVISKNAEKFYYMQTENLAIPFAQNIGFMNNRKFSQTVYHVPFNLGIFIGGGFPSPTNMTFGFNLRLGDRTQYIDSNGSSLFSDGILNSTQIVHLNSQFQNPGRIPEPFLSVPLQNGGGFTHHRQYIKYYKSEQDLRILNLTNGGILNFFNGFLPSLSYKQTHIFNAQGPTIYTNTWVPKDSSSEIYPPFSNTVNKTFNPGYLAYFEESIAYQKRTHYDLVTPIIEKDFSWLDVAWPWLKYTSGQFGAVEFLPNYGNEGGIFMQMFNKPSYDGSPSIYKNRCIIQEDINYSGSLSYGDAEPLELDFKFYVFNVETLEFQEKTEINNALIRHTQDHNYPIQITGVKADPETNDLYIIGKSFTNKNTINNPFSPFDVEGLLLWFPDFNIEQTGGASFEWLDEVSHSTKISGNYGTGSIELLNGKKVIKFDVGSSSINSSILGGLSGFTLGCLVAKNIDTFNSFSFHVARRNTNQDALGLTGIASQSSLTYKIQTNGVTRYSVGDNTTFPILKNEYLIIFVTYEFFNSANGNLKLYCTGNSYTDLGTININNNSWTSYSLTSHEVGDVLTIGEFFYYNRVLNTTEINQLGQYYNQKFGLLNWVNI